MALLKCNRHWSNSWSTTNVLAFARGRANGKLGGICWRFLSTKSNRQLWSKMEETTYFYTHIPLLLTYFHLYWRINVLQDTHSNTSGKQSKRRKAESVMQKCAKEIHAKAHPIIKSGPSTDMDMAQAHTGTNHVKAVARRPNQGAAAPQLLPPGPGML